MQRIVLSLLLIAFVFLSVSSFTEKSLFIAHESTFSTKYLGSHSDIFRNSPTSSEFLIYRQYQTAKKPFIFSWQIFSIDKTFDTPQFISQLNKNQNILSSYHPAPLQFFEVLVI